MSHVDAGDTQPVPAETPAATDVTTPPITATPSPVEDAGATPSPVAAFDCSTVPEAPVAFEALEGFTSSEDFVFDELGNYVGIDPNGNLIRVSKEGEKQLWSPAIGDIAGMGILRDGSVVFNDVGHGALKRVYPDGSVAVVLGGLLYPNGLDVGPDGFVYVAENGAGRVRRVDADTGEFSIVAMGLEGPNGVAFGNDPTLLYIGSFEGSGVYEVKLGASGQLGEARVFARVPGSRLREPILACPEQEEGADCRTSPFAGGRCEALANVVDCMPVDPCPGLEDEASCYHPGPGSCQSGRCVPLPNPCDGLRQGDACQDPFTGAGVCQTFGGELLCGAPNPCDGLRQGDACQDPYAGAGTCDDFGSRLLCSVPNPCDGQREGAACDDPYFGLGACRAYAEGLLYCSPPNVCDGLSEGDACDDPFGVGRGVCYATGAGLTCEPPNPCAGVLEGTACDDPFYGSGVCQAFAGATMLYCAPPNVCDGSSEGDACEDTFSGPGVCNDYEGSLYCGPPNPCAALREGDACEDDFFGRGFCGAYEGLTTLYCQLPNPCDGLDEGAVCVDPFSRLEGICQGGYCSVSGGGLGNIDGLGVDACGNVYASEYTSGTVWRISPEGAMEILVQLPSSWIPNVKWGRGVGGFSDRILYIADRDESRLFAVSVGVPGATEFFSMVP